MIETITTPSKSLTRDGLNYRGLKIPFVSFGKVTSDDLFCAKEQPIFEFYARNKNRYRRVLDIGANIGVHSLLMARNEWAVQAFDPDPEHFKLLRRNIAETPVIAVQAAVSDAPGQAEFVRVKGNTTGSHLAGDKMPYGELERFKVDVVDCKPLFAWADFAKIDCEGGEARILLTVRPEQRCEFMVEVGSPANAEAIYEHFAGRVGMWAQQLDWDPVRGLGDMPAHHSHGALFIGREAPF